MYRTVLTKLLNLYNIISFATGSVRRKVQKSNFKCMFTSTICVYSVYPNLAVAGIYDCKFRLDQLPGEVDVKYVESERQNGNMIVVGSFGSHIATPQLVKDALYVYENYEDGSSSTVMIINHGEVIASRTTIVSIPKTSIEPLISTSRGLCKYSNS